MTAPKGDILTLEMVITISGWKESKERLWERDNDKNLR